MHNSSLKFRIVLSLVIIVTVTGSLFALGILLLKQKLEENILGNMVHDQLEVIIQELDDGNFENKLFQGWTLYSTNSNNQPDPIIKALPTGLHHSVQIDNRYFHVEVGQWRGEPLYLTYDITEWENTEHELLHWLAIGIAILAVATIIMGYTASKSILAPVAAFTKRLKHIRPDERNVQVSSEFKGNEIGQIAKAFDQYLARMDQFVERERNFTAAASHELRNPLSVMLGAMDVIEANNPDLKSQAAIARIKRAIGEMEAFIEATLFMSREESRTVVNEDGAVELETIIKNLTEDNHNAILERQIKLEIAIQENILIKAPASLIKITIGNLLRNAIEHTRKGNVSITIADNKCIVKDDGEGINQENIALIFNQNFSTKHEGTGMGLNLVRRICDRFHWEIDVKSELGSGTEITLTFPGTYS